MAQTYWGLHFQCLAEYVFRIICILWRQVRLCVYARWDWIYNVHKSQRITRPCRLFKYALLRCIMIFHEHWSLSQSDYFIWDFVINRCIKTGRNLSKYSLRKDHTNVSDEHNATNALPWVNLIHVAQELFDLRDMVLLVCNNDNHFLLTRP